MKFGSYAESRFHSLDTFLVCYIVWSGRWISAFRGIILLPVAEYSEVSPLIVLVTPFISPSVRRCVPPDSVSTLILNDGLSNICCVSRIYLLVR